MAGLTTVFNQGGGAGAASITGAGQITSAEAFGSPAVSLTINSAGIASAEAFGFTSVVAGISPAGIASSEAFGLPTISVPDEARELGAKLRRAAREQRYIYRRFEIEKVVPVEAAEAIERVLEHYEETPDANLAGAAQLLALELSEQGLNPLAAYNDVLNYELARLERERLSDEDDGVMAAIAALI